MQSTSTIIIITVSEDCTVAVAVGGSTTSSSNADSSNNKIYTVSIDPALAARIRWLRARALDLFEINTRRRATAAATATTATVDDDVATEMLAMRGHRVRMFRLITYS